MLHYRSPSYRVARMIYGKIGVTLNHVRVVVLGSIEIGKIARLSIAVSAFCGINTVSRTFYLYNRTVGRVVCCALIRQYFGDSNAAFFRHTGLGVGDVCPSVTAVRTCTYVERRTVYNIESTSVGIVIAFAFETRIVTLPSMTGTIT